MSSCCSVFTYFLMLPMYVPMAILCFFFMNDSIQFGAYSTAAFVITAFVVIGALFEWQTFAKLCMCVGIAFRGAIVIFLGYTVFKMLAGGPDADDDPMKLIFGNYIFFGGVNKVYIDWFGGEQGIEGDSKKSLVQFGVFAYFVVEFLFYVVAGFGVISTMRPQRRYLQTRTHLIGDNFPDDRDGDFVDDDDDHERVARM